MSSKRFHSVAILAGGRATRLHPLTERIPKSLLDVNGEPFIAHQLHLLYARNIRRVVLCLGYLGEMVLDFVGDGSRFGLEVAYSFDGPKPLGTGGAVKKCLHLLDPQFFVIYGDSYLPCDYSVVMESFLASGKKALMTVYRNDGLFDTSNVEFADGKILTYDKTACTDRMKYIDYGLGAFNGLAFQDVPEDKPTDLAEIYCNLLGAGRLAACEVSQRFYENGSLEGLKQTSEFIAQQSAADVRVQQRN